MPKCDVKTRYIPATFAWALLITATTLFFYYPARYYLSDYPWVLIYQGVLTFFVIANFSLATFMDPGVIPKAPPDEDRDDDFRAPLYKNIEVRGVAVRMKWCVTCKFYRPPRCSHCSVCNHCIETFDHHCPWVNNCIGRRNYRFFFFFLITLSLHMISIFSLSLLYILNYTKSYSNVEPIVAIALMALISILAIPIFGLTGFHMVLVSRGKTTNEQVTGKFKGYSNPYSRGCWGNCCYIQFGPQFPSLKNAKKYNVKPKYCPHGPISTIASDNQVKTYMDNSNGVRNLNSHAYNKLSPGRDGCDLEMEPSASQSQDCEPTPPLQRHGSKNNFYLPQGVVPDGGGESPRHPRPNVHYPRSSPHPRPRGLDPGFRGTPNEGPQRPSPTLQQRIKAQGVPTPLAMSSPIRRSNPSTPTQPRRPDFIGISVNHHHHQPPPPSSMTSSTTSTTQYYDFQQQTVGGGAATMHHTGGGQHGYHGRPLISCGGGGQNYGGSPQRRFMSEGELVRQEAQLSYPRSNNTVDNIRELANSPQRGVYMWKDTSPGYAQAPPQHTEYFRSNPTSPTQQVYTTAPTRTYHPASRGGVPVYPPASPQVHRKMQQLNASTTSVQQQDNRRRPISFVRALEISDGVELSQQMMGGGQQQCPAPHQSQQRPPSPERTSVYDMNYEISV